MAAALTKEGAVVGEAEAEVEAVEVEEKDSLSA